MTEGEDFVPFSGIRAPSLSFSSFDLFGGKGGRLEGSYAGALTLGPSIEGALDPDVRAVPFDMADTEDIVETIEDIDSVESRLLSCSEGLRGGKAGECCDCGTEGLLGGSVGGATLSAQVPMLCPVRLIVGGGRAGGRLGPLGSFPMPLFCEYPLLCVGMVAVFRDSRRGFGAGHGLGLAVMGALPTCPRLRAAIRAWIDCCWGSSSLIVASATA